VRNERAVTKGPEVSCARAILASAGLRDASPFASSVRSSSGTGLGVRPLRRLVRNERAVTKGRDVRCVRRIGAQPRADGRGTPEGCLGWTGDPTCSAAQPLERCPAPSGWDAGSGSRRALVRRLAAVVGDCPSDSRRVGCRGDGECDGHTGDSRRQPRVYGRSASRRADHADAVGVRNARCERVGRAVRGGAGREGVRQVRDRVS